jgi:predicted permease
VAFAFVLLSGAGLVVRSLTGLVAVDIGFEISDLALGTVFYPTGTESTEEAGFLFRELEDRVRELPGVVEVGSANQMPFYGGWSSPPVTMETPEGEQDVALHMPTVTAGYFSTMGIHLMEGRGLSDEDTMDTDLVVVVSKALADRLTPNGSPLGLRIRLNIGEDPSWRTIVGVVSDVRYRLDWGAMRMAYVPAGQDAAYLGNWVIRTAGDPEAVASAFREIWEELDPEGSTTFQRMDDVVNGSNAAVSARFSVYLLGSLAGLAGVLAVVGVYGVLAYLVQLRSREIGIQLALGADRGTVVNMILRRGLLMGAGGLLGGLLLALAMGRIMESQLFGVEPWDPIALGAAGGLMLFSTVAASYLPAYRASRLDPVDVLKGK